MWSEGEIQHQETDTRLWFIPANASSETPLPRTETPWAGEPELPAPLSPPPGWSSMVLPSGTERGDETFRGLDSHLLSIMLQMCLPTCVCGFLIDRDRDGPDN